MRESKIKCLPYEEKIKQENSFRKRSPAAWKKYNGEPFQQQQQQPNQLWWYALFSRPQLTAIYIYFFFFLLYNFIFDNVKLVYFFSIFAALINLLQHVQRCSGHDRNGLERVWVCTISAMQRHNDGCLRSFRLRQPSNYLITPPYSPTQTFEMYKSYRWLAHVTRGHTNEAKSNGASGICAQFVRFWSESPQQSTLGSHSIGSCKTLLNIFHFFFFFFWFGKSGTRRDCAEAKAWKIFSHCSGIHYSVSLFISSHAIPLASAPEPALTTLFLYPLMHRRHAEPRKIKKYAHKHTAIILRNGET